MEQGSAALEVVVRDKQHVEAQRWRKKPHAEGLQDLTARQGQNTRV